MSVMSTIIIKFVISFQNIQFCKKLMLFTFKSIKRKLYLVANHKDKSQTRTINNHDNHSLIDHIASLSAAVLYTCITYNYPIVFVTSSIFAIQRWCVGKKANSISTEIQSVFFSPELLLITLSLCSNPSDVHLHAQINLSQENTLCCHKKYSVLTVYIQPVTKNVHCAQNTFKYSKVSNTIVSIKI